MDFLACRTRIADDTNTNLSIAGDRIGREVNRVCSQEWNGFRWSFRWRNYRIVTDIDVTGTVSAVNGSRTITGTGFLPTQTNWHIVFTQDSIQNWYKVSYTSSTQLELDVPYQGTSGSRSFILRHFDYILPTEPWDLGSVIVTSDNKPLTILEPSSMDLMSPIPLSSGVPEAVSIYSSDTIQTVYSTGTVSGTIDTNILTGSATSWLSNVYPGDLVTIGSYKYTVYKVDSDTQITLYNKQKITSAVSTTYTIAREFGRILRVMWPSAYAYTLDIRALRIYNDLVNDSDTNELLYRFPNAVVLKTSAMELKQQNDVRSQSLMAEAEIAWMKARADDDSLTSREAVAPIYSYRLGSSVGWRNWR